MSATITTKITKAAEALRLAESGLSAAIERYKTVKALCGQQGYSITIGSVGVQVAIMDHRTYTAKLARGCEMIHLGALKALEAEADRFRAQARECRAELAELGAALSKLPPK